MKTIIEALVKLFRASAFTFDKRITINQLLWLFYVRLFMMIRGLKIKLFFPSSGLVFLGRTVRISGRCKFGKSVTIGDFSRVSGLCLDYVEFGNYVSIGRYSSVIASTSYNFLGKGISIGQNVAIGEYAYLGGAGGLRIGSDTIVGQYFSCHPENHNFLNKDTLIRHQGVSRKGIEIGNNVWIGSKVTFLDGSSVGDGSVVAAGSVVTESFGDRVLIGGVPARILKSLE